MTETPKKRFSASQDHPPEPSRRIRHAVENIFQKIVISSKDSFEQTIFITSHQNFHETVLAKNRKRIGNLKMDPSSYIKILAAI